VKTRLLVPHFRRLSDYFGCWAIEPNAGRSLWELASRTDLAAHVADDEPPKPKSQIILYPVNGSNDRNVAVIPVAGPLMKAVPSLSAGTSTVQLRRDIRAAAADPKVSAILLAIDSPGGTVSGTADLAAEVARARKSKPVWAQAEDLTASAAYWVASQCEQIWVNQGTALVGSIGTLMVIYDLAGAAEKEGVRTLVFATGNLKGAGAAGAPVTDAQAEYFQRIVDAAQESFDAAVRKGRSLSEKQLKAVRSGEVFPAGEAVRLGLADGVRSMESTIQALAAAAGRRPREGRAASPPTPPIGAKTRVERMGFEAWLASKGFTDIDALSDDQRTSLRAMYDAEMVAAANPPVPVVNPHRPSPEPDPAPAADPVAEYRERIAAEQERVSQINTICARYGSPTFMVQGEKVDLASHAIREGWSAEKVELEALRSSRPNPAIISRSHETDCTRDTLTAALMLGAGFDFNANLPPVLAANPRLPAWVRAGVNADQRQRVLEQGHRFAGISAMDLARECARLNGKPVSGYDDGEILAAATSGGALTHIFTDSINLRLLVTFMEHPDTSAAWCQITEVGDFKENKDIRLKKAGGMKKLPRGGTADHGSREDEAETFSVARYAEQIVVDEQDMIDDAIGAIMEFPVEMGNEARRIEPDLVYYVLLSNPTLEATGRALFNTTDGNYVASGAALAADKLRVGVQKMYLYQENGVNLNIRPRYLLAGPSLRHLSYELAKSAQILVCRAGTTDTTVERGANNALLADGLVPVTDARLENGVTDPDSGATASGSATKWILVGENVPTVLKAYRRGTGRMPRVRSFTLDKGQWGMGWDINHDVGAAPRGWRGFYQGNG
jgi:signal peptide peptidase SppA